MHTSRPSSGKDNDLPCPANEARPEKLGSRASNEESDESKDVPSILKSKQDIYTDMDIGAELERYGIQL